MNTRGRRRMICCERDSVDVFGSCEIIEFREKLVTLSPLSLLLSLIVG